MGFIQFFVGYYANNFLAVEKSLKFLKRIQIQ